MEARLLVHTEMAWTVLPPLSLRQAYSESEQHPYISPISPLDLPISPLHLPYISPRSPLHLRYISPTSPPCSPPNPGPGEMWAFSEP